MSWQVHREVSVLFGGARALLLQAAHPLVIAGAVETGFYERDPWKRLDRTLRLTYAVTFGPEDLAVSAAEHINRVHERVQGVDPVTGRHYDALDPELLLWVHACLVDSALRFEALTVGKLDEAGRQRFHEEQMIVAEMLRLPRDQIPPTVEGLREYMDEVVASGDLVVGDAALRLAEIFRDPPRDAQWRRVLRHVAWWAFGSLPPTLQEAYGVTWDAKRERALRLDMRFVKTLRPIMPARLRYIAPYVAWMKGEPFPEVPGLLRQR